MSDYAGADIDFGCGLSVRQWQEFQGVWPAELVSAYEDKDCHDTGRFIARREGNAVRFDTHNGEFLVWLRV